MKETWVIEWGCEAELFRGRRQKSGCAYAVRPVSFMSVLPSARLDKMIDGTGLGASYLGCVVAVSVDYCLMASAIIFELGTSMGMWPRATKRMMVCSCAIVRLHFES